MNLELRIAELEQRAVEQPILSEQILATTITDASNAKRFISVNGALRNDGKRTLEF
jgi:hypothetical protein